MEGTFQLFYVGGYLISSPSRNEIYDVYDYLQGDFNIEDNGEINEYLGTELDHRPNGSSYLRQTYRNQSIINLIPGMEN